jgi:DNA polymerase III subunit epsilon
VDLDHRRIAAQSAGVDEILLSPVGKLSTWIGVAFASFTAVSLLLGSFLLIGLSEVEGAVLAQVLERRAALLLLGVLLVLAACAGAMKWLFARHVTALRVVAEQTRVIRGANPDLRLVSQPTRELGELASAINGLADAYQGLKRDSELRAVDTRARLEEERNRLAALMSELSQGVLVCNAEGMILLYNEQARALFAPPGSRSAQAMVGLGRSVFGLIDRGQIAHAMHRIEISLARGERVPMARFVATTPAGRLIKAQLAPYLDGAAHVAGTVFALEDVTDLLNREAQRRSLLQAFAARIRAPSANIRAAAESLSSYPDIEASRRAQFIDIVAAESRSLTATINEALHEYADALKAALTLENIRTEDLLEFARQRIEETLGLAVEVQGSEKEVWLRADSYALVQTMLHLATRLREHHAVRSLTLRARAVERFAEIDLEWSGAIVSGEALPLWEAEPMESGQEQSPLTVRDVLEQHGGELWYQRGGVAGARTGGFRFLLPRGESAAVPARALSIGPSRPEYYDFDLFRDGAVPAALNDARLISLAYTVFDTETTGLQPSAGDEIISIGAVRVLNGRLLRNEVFEQLINPMRPLNRESARVHGLDAAALEGQPSIGEVLPVFHRFCEDTVLVGHNAAFDMRFLELKQASTGVHFRQPVLDTLLLSALAHPSLGDHRLEAIAERLGVSVIGRHTALGDALLTGEIFLKLLPLLAERGIVTLGQVLAASRETYYARLQY